MFTPKRSTTLTSSGSARVTRSQSLKTKHELSPRVSIGSTMNSSLIYSDSLLESYKTPLPIKVSEIIAQVAPEDLSQFNATILPNGHVCFTTDRKLYIWKLRKSYKNIQCNELTLPFAKTKVKQNCVHVECYNNKEYVAICVTAEGNIRFWPSIFSEINIDSKCDLAANDEVAYLTILSRNSYLMITSNGQMWSITVDSATKLIACSKIVDASSSLLSGIGRRVTSFIYGGSVNKNVPSFKCVLRYGESDEIYVLCDKTLQKWRFNSENYFTSTFQLDLQKLFYEAYISQRPNFTKCNVMFQDGSITKNSVYVLAVIEDDDLQFVVGELSTNMSQTDLRLKSFHILNYKLSAIDIQNVFHIQAMHNQHAFYLHNNNCLIAFTGPTLDLMGETKFFTSGDRLFASCLFDNDLIFFSLNHGILKARDSSIGVGIQEDSILMNSLIDNKTLPSQSFAMPNFNQTAATLHDMSNASFQSGDESYKLHSRQLADFTLTNINPEQSVLLRFKAAFQLYLRKEERESEAIIREIYETSSSAIDFLCVELSEKLIDDVPAHDPRWAELTTKTGKSLNANLIISNQLNGKMRLHEYFISFLKSFGIWTSLNTVNYNNREILTRLALEEHGEKLRLALFIREQLYTKYPDLLNAAIEYTTKNREDLSTKLVYPHDVFYRRVSKIDDIFNALIYVEQDVMKSNSNEQAINYLIDTTYSFIKLLTTAQSYLNEKSRLYEAQNQNETKLEYIRWTFLSAREMITSPNSILNLFTKQHKLCADYGLLNCNSIEKKSVLLQYLFDLDSVLFEEYEIRLNSIKALNLSQKQYRTEYLTFEKSYNTQKTKLIDVFVKNKLNDNALKLAEKYVDYHTLVSVCEMTNNCDLLETYLDKFADKEFAEFVVNYFTDKRKLNFLLKNDFIKRTDIARCLDNYKILSWIKDVKNDNFTQAAKTLSDLAVQENDSYAKRKTLLSLSKLSLLANGEDDEGLKTSFEKINRRLAYLSYIDQLPDNIIRNLGLEHDLIPNFKAEKLIELYITNEKSNEYCFKIALELLDYLNDDSTVYYTSTKIEELKNRIFVQAILVNDWNKICESDNPEVELGETKFFKTINLMKQSGEDLRAILPSINDILSHELLSEHIQNKTFVYLLKASYELLTL